MSTWWAEHRTEVLAMPGGPVEYRWQRRGEPVVVAFHGGHLRAGLSVGEQVFVSAGASVLAPSRPGYGRTALSAGPGPGRFADTVRRLCEHLGVDRPVTALGTSAGGPSALWFAARHGDLVDRLVLQSAVGRLPWPDLRTRLGAGLVFHPRAERATWAAVRAGLRRHPDATLRLLLRDLSSRPVREVMGRMSAADRADLCALFARMRSGSGFRNDLRPSSDPSAQVRARTLVIATPHDGGVPFAHARDLVTGIEHAQLLESRADSHFLWLGADWPQLASVVSEFLG